MIKYKSYLQNNNPAIAYTAYQYLINLEKVLYERDKIINPIYPEEIKEENKHHYLFSKSMSHMLLGDNEVWNIEIFNKSVKIMKLLNTLCTEINPKKINSSFLIKNEDHNVNYIKYFLNKGNYKLLGILPHYNYEKIIMDSNYFQQFYNKSINNKFMVLRISK